MKKSIEVENYWIKKYPNNIYHLLFNTSSKWPYYHRFTNTTFQIGSDPGERHLDDMYYTQEIPENLIPSDIPFVVLTMQDKDQTSFYFIPRNILFRSGETIIYNSKDHEPTENI